MNCKIIFKLVLPVAISVSSILLSSTSMAGDLQLKPLNSPLSKKPAKTTADSTKKSGETSIVGPAMSPPVTGVNSNSLTPTNTRTQQSIQQRNVDALRVNRSVKDQMLAIVNSFEMTQYNAQRDLGRAYDNNWNDFRNLTRQYKEELNRCGNKSYNSQDQINAGCRNSDSITQCQKKLIKHCSSNIARNLGNTLLKFNTISISVKKVADEAIRNRSKGVSNGLWR